MKRAFRDATLQCAATLLFAAGLFAQQVKGPILRIESNPTDFDTAMCGTSKCRMLTFRNVGDTLLTVRSADQILSPFSGTIPVPFSLAPDASRSFTVCYRQTTAPRADSQWVYLRADTRVSLSIAMLFDTSSSMNQRIGPSDATLRITAAHDAGIDFLSGLLNTPDVQDEAAVCVFADTGDYGVRRPFTTDVSLLQASVPARGTGAATCLYWSLVQTVNQLLPRSKTRVLIALTDGAENCRLLPGWTPQNVIDDANAADVTIFAVGIGEAIADSARLSQIATATGGQFFSASTATDLIAVYRRIATLLSQNMRTSFLLRGRSVTPVMSLSPSSLDFDSVCVNQMWCDHVVVGNSGDAPLTITSMSGLAPPFSFQPSLILPLVIPPGNQVTVNICFTPARLRVQTDTLTVRGNGCGQPTFSVALRGVGWDSVTVALQDSFRARPGSVINIPIRLRGTVPAEYAVDSCLLAITYNKTLMYPSDNSIVRIGTLSEAFSSTSFTQTFTQTEATMTVRFGGGRLASPGPDSVLVRLGFLVLHGNSMETPVSVSSAAFADGNPRAGLLQPGRLRADSLCNQCDRLIDAGDRFGNSLSQNSPNPFNPITTIRYSIAKPGWVRVVVFDVLGRETAILVDAWREPGRYEIVFDASGKPSGAYFCAIESGAFRDVKQMTVVK